MIKSVEVDPILPRAKGASGIKGSTSIDRVAHKNGTQYLADLLKIREAYVQDVKENRLKGEGRHQVGTNYHQ